jgi:hypothetical protein
VANGGAGHPTDRRCASRPPAYNLVHRFANTVAYSADPTAPLHYGRGSACSLVQSHDHQHPTYGAAFGRICHNPTW